MGAGGLAWLLRTTGLSAVMQAVGGARVYFPLILALEGAFLACSILALRALYGAEARSLPFTKLVRAGLVGYSIMGIVPAGRAVAEAARAEILATEVGRPRAWAAGVTAQGVSLVANAAISLLATAAVLRVTGFSLPAALIFGNGVITAVLGSFILAGGPRLRAGSFLGARFRQFAESGPEFDRRFAEIGAARWPALGWEFLGRCFQVTQNGILVLAVGGMLGVLPAFGSEALHLTGAALGDLIPGQLGATEASFRMSGELLGVPVARALSIALLAHAAQLVWILVGLGPLFWVNGLTGNQKKRLVSSGAALVALGCFYSPARADDMVFGPNDVATVFFISKSDDHNRVDYGIRLNSDCRPSPPDEAVFYYWREFEKAPPVRVHDHGFMDPLAYGIADQHLTEAGGYVLRLRRVNREILIKIARLARGGCSAAAFMDIGGTPGAHLENVYVKLSGLMSVEYIEIHGSDAKTGAPVVERLSH